MSEFTQQLKAKADIGQVIGEYVALKPGGNGFVGLCPFHGEKSPSFHVHVAKGFYYCFGCHVHGDIFRFLMEYKKLSFPEAVEAVAERLGIPVPKANDAGSDPTRRVLGQIHEAATGFFVRQLADRAGTAARAYVQSRGYEPAATDLLQVGYAPGSGRALTQFLQTQGFATALVLRSGLCQPRRETQTHLQEEGLGWDDLYDRFRDRLMFPIADERGHVIAFGGRALTADARTPKYLNSPESPLYTKGRVLYNLHRAKEAIRQLGYAILVEGYFDCLRVFSSGFENVVASCGTALTAAQVSTLQRLTQKAVINFDPDAAGAAAAERSIGLLLEHGYQMRVVVLPGGQDPDLFIRQAGRDAYGQALKSSRSFFDYLSGRMRQMHDLRRGEGKVAAVNHLLPYLNRVPDAILRQNLAENLAAQLGLEQSLISRQLVQAARDRQGHIASSNTGTSELLAAERILLRVWVEQPARRAEFAGRVAESLFAGLASAPLAERLSGWTNEDIDMESVATQLEEADRKLLALVMFDTHELEPLSPGVVESAVETLRLRAAEQHARQIPDLIRQAAAAGDRAQVEALAREKAAWDAQRSQAKV